MMGWGTGSSPVLDGDRLFVLCDNEEKSFLVALDKKTGDELWRASPRRQVELVHAARLEEQAAHGAGRLGQHHVARTIRRPARCCGKWPASATALARRPRPTKTCSTSAPAAAWAAPGRSWRFAPEPRATSRSKTAKRRASSVAWSRRAGRPDDGLAAACTTAACMWSAIEAASASATTPRPASCITKSGMDGATGFTSSPWAAGGKIFCLDQAGTTFVLEPGPSSSCVGKNRLDDTFWSSAAIAGNSAAAPRREPALLHRGGMNALPATLRCELWFAARTTVIPANRSHPNYCGIVAGSSSAAAGTVRRFGRRGGRSWRSRRDRWRWSCGRFGRRCRSSRFG